MILAVTNGASPANNAATKKRLIFGLLVGSRWKLNVIWKSKGDGLSG